MGQVGALAQVKPLFARQVIGMRGRDRQACHHGDGVPHVHIRILAGVRKMVTKCTAGRCHQRRQLVQPDYHCPGCYRQKMRLAGGLMWD